VNTCVGECTIKHIYKWIYSCILDFCFAISSSLFTTGGVILPPQFGTMTSGTEGKGYKKNEKFVLLPSLQDTPLN